MFTSASSNPFMATAVRHRVSGRLVDFQASPRPNLDPAPRIANAIAEAGGTAGDWELIAIPDEIAQELDFTVEQTCDVKSGRAVKLKKGKRIPVTPEPEPEPDLYQRVAELERLVAQLSKK